MFVLTSQVDHLNFSHWTRNNCIKTTKIEIVKQCNSVKKCILAYQLCIMHFLYNFLTHISAFFIWVSQVFNPKMKLFFKGRKLVFDQLKTAVDKDDLTIW